jgi:hypothetical protein
MADQIAIPSLRHARPINAHAAGAAPLVRGPTDSPRPFSEILGSLARQVDRGERVVARALNTNTGSSAAVSMIALQAGVYRYVEAVDLCTKLIDRAANALRTTLQNQ